jgi:hypothetical protein
MAVLFLWSICICVRAQEASKTQVVSGPDYKIVSQSVEKSGSLNGQPLYTLSYRFDFHNRDKIFLQEFGNIEANGELSYLSPSKVVEFWSRDRREKLATVEFQETGASRGGEAEEMPALKTFLPVKRPSPWPRNVPAKLNVLKVVTKYYQSGARAWIENDTQYFETLFEPLGSLPKGILGQVALLISFPTVPNSDPYNIDVQAAIQERRRLEDWRNDNISPETSNSANTFIALFAADLERASGSQ